MKKNKIKILFITRSFPPTTGGMENFSYGLYKNLKTLTETKLIANKKSYKGLIPFAIKSFIYTTLFSYKFDVVYCNDMLTSFLALPSKLIYKKPLVTTTYGLDINYIFCENASLLQNVLKNFYGQIVRFIIPHITIFVPISCATAKLGNKLAINTEKIITPGIDPTEITINTKIKNKYSAIIKRNYGIPIRKRVLLFLGRVIKRKGLVWFVRYVFPNIKNDYHLIVAGTGYDLKEVISLSKKKKLVDNITILGHVPNNQKRELFIGADIFIMPNIKIRGQWEGFGITAIEASMYGTPVVAAKVEGITSAVTDDKNGLLFISKNAKDCVKKISKATALIPKATKISKFTKKNFSNSKLARSYLDIFKTLVQ